MFFFNFKDRNHNTFLPALGAGHLRSAAWVLSGIGQDLEGRSGWERRAHRTPPGNPYGGWSSLKLHKVAMGLIMLLVSPIDHLCLRLPEVSWMGLSQLHVCRKSQAYSWRKMGGPPGSLYPMEAAPQPTEYCSVKPQRLPAKGHVFSDVFDAPHFSVKANVIDQVITIVTKSNIITIKWWLMMDHRANDEPIDNKPFSSHRYIDHQVINQKLLKR